MSGPLGVRRAVLVAGLLIAVALHGAPAFEPGDRVEVLWEGAWFEAAIVEATDESCLVHYVGWDHDYDEWVDDERIRYPDGVDPNAVSTLEQTGSVHEIGSNVEVLYGESWWPAVVVGLSGDKYRIRYDGYDESYDEWVDDSRIRLPLVPEPVTLPFRPAEAYPISKGDAVQIQSSGSTYWYNGRVADVSDDRYLVRYDGYDEASDEWVYPNRVRTPLEGEIWDALMYRFWYDLSIDGTLGYFAGEEPPPPEEYREGAQVFPADISLDKREQPFARIDTHGRVWVHGTPIGRLLPQDGAFTIRRNGLLVGSVSPDGIVRGMREARWPREFHGSLRVDERGNVTAGTEALCTLDARTRRVYVNGGVWGYYHGEEFAALPTTIAAFLLFFTELPHAALRFHLY